ncbi:hypothetical protein AAMO2058_001489200 [Amorphochlora amoebiformis]
MSREDGKVPSRFKGKQQNDLVNLLTHRRCKTRKQGTLLCFIQGLVGNRVRIELRNDSIIKGRLVSVDELMGCKMVKASMRRQGFPTKQYEDLYIPGRQILYVHIPDDVDISRTLDQQFNRYKGRR